MADDTEQNDSAPRQAKILRYPGKAKGKTERGQFDVYDDVEATLLDASSNKFKHVVVLGIDDNGDCKLLGDREIDTKDMSYLLMCLQVSLVKIMKD